MRNTVLVQAPTRQSLLAAMQNEAASPPAICLGKNLYPLIGGTLLSPSRPQKGSFFVKITSRRGSSVADLPAIRQGSGFACPQ